MKARLVGPVGVGAVPYVTQEDIEAVVSMWTGIPVEHMLQDERDRLQRLPQALKVRPSGLCLLKFLIEVIQDSQQLEHLHQLEA